MSDLPLPPEAVEAAVKALMANAGFIGGADGAHEIAVIVLTAGCGDLRERLEKTEKERDDWQLEAENVAEQIAPRGRDD